MKNSKIIRGLLGENIAQNYLESQEHQILAKRYRCCYGEIDLISEKKKELYFIEVKYRQQKNYGEGWEAVGYSKLATIKKVSQYYLNKEARNLGLRRHKINYAIVSIMDLDGSSKIEWIVLDPFLDF